MTVPHLNCTEGDVVYARGVVVEASSDCFKVRFENFPKYVMTAYVPVSEIAKAEDIHLLNPMRLKDLKYLDPAYNEVKAKTT